MSFYRLAWMAFPVLVAMVAWSNLSTACPFCPSISSTLSGQLNEARAAVVARCEFEVSETSGLRSYRMRVTDVVKGDSRLTNHVVRVEANRELREGESFLLVAYDGSRAWAAPREISSSGVAYVRKLNALPPKGADRLAFFLQFLKHTDEIVAKDAYNEFARASLQEMGKLRDQIDRSWVVAQLRDSATPLHRRRLCWMLLSQCGTAADAGLFDELIRDRTTKAGSQPALGPAIACFITLGGEDALASIERDYLVNAEAEYADTYAAIRAIRVHGEQLSVFPRRRLAVAMGRVLERPPLADLVLADLARWEDWSVVDRVKQLYESANEDSSFVKAPAVQYLAACPLPTAAAALEELRKTDPSGVEKAEALATGAKAVTPTAIAPTKPDASEPKVAAMRRRESSRSSRLKPFITVAILLGALVGGMSFVMWRRTG